MIRQTFALFFLCSSMLALSQKPAASNTASKPDSADFFLQKGLKEKQTGRRMEAFRNFEKAYQFDSSNKVIVGELAASYYDLRKYNQAKDTYKKLEGLGD